MSRDRLTVAISGASGSAYALNLLGHLRRLAIPLDLVVSPSAAIVLRREIDADRVWIGPQGPVLADFGLHGADVRSFAHKDLLAPIASGTALRRGMVIAPCSMGTLGRIAAGTSGNLIERAADVCLKERRRLALLFRESPLSLIHIRNLKTVTEAGAIVMPAAPGFYAGATTIEHLLDHVSAKVLDVLGIEHDVIERWGGEGES